MDSGQRLSRRADFRRDGEVAGDAHSEDAAWVAGDDNEDMPPMVFPSVVAAYRAWERSAEVAVRRKQRGEESLRRLERKETQQAVLVFGLHPRTYATSIQPRQERE